MTLKETIQNDMKDAMKQKNQFKVDTLRMVIAELRKGEIDSRKEFTDDEVLRIIKKGVKTREDAIVLFKQGSRDDLVEKESREIEILKQYLPQQLTIEQTEKIVEDTIFELKASSAKDIGIVMRHVMQKYGSQLDGKTVQEVARIKLS